MYISVCFYIVLYFTLHKKNNFIYRKKKSLEHIYLLKRLKLKSRLGKVKTEKKFTSGQN
jgi:hypothetical protein